MLFWHWWDIVFMMQTTACRSTPPPQHRIVVTSLTIKELFPVVYLSHSHTVIIISLINLKTRAQFILSLISLVPRPIQLKYKGSWIYLISPLINVLPTPSSLVWNFTEMLCSLEIWHSYTSQLGLIPRMLTIYQMEPVIWLRTAAGT